MPIATYFAVPFSLIGATGAAACCGAMERNRIPSVSKHKRDILYLSHMAHLPGVCSARFDVILNNLDPGSSLGLVVGAIAHRAKRGVTSRRSMLELLGGVKIGLQSTLFSWEGYALHQ